MLRLRPADANADARKSARSSGFAVKNSARFYAIHYELLARSLDVGDSYEQSLGRTGRGRREVHAELDRAGGTGRCELDQAEIVTSSAIGVQTPPEL